MKPFNGKNVWPTSNHPQNRVPHLRRKATKVGIRTKTGVPGQLAARGGKLELDKIQTLPRDLLGTDYQVLSKTKRASVFTRRNARSSSLRSLSNTP